MKNLRKLLLLVLVIILSGCSVKYELVINKDSSVNEKVIAKEHNTKIRKNTGMTTDQAVLYLYELFDREGLKTKITTIEEDGFIKSTVTGYHNSVDEYALNFTSDIFATPGIERDGSKVTLLFEQFRKINPDDINRLIYDDIEVSITLPFKVLEHNADKKRGNTYTWVINSKQDFKQIKLVYDEKKIKDKVKINFFDSSFDIRYEFIAIGAIALVILIVIIIVLINNKKNNKV
ncbi:MAG: hypothetical protein IKE73_05295 [Bacilli bacterium]|nr:hypothetical protein [Bacilli bacterium]